MQNAAFRALGLQAVYVPLRCARRRCAGADAGPAPRGRRRQRHRAAQGSRRASGRTVCRELVEAVGACNTFWGEDGADVGDNTDVHGLLAALRRSWSRREAPWLIAGTGGGARAAVVGGRASAARRSRCALASADRRRRVRGLGSTLAGVALAPAAECRVLINATPLGLAAERPAAAVPPARARARGRARHGVRARARRRGSGRMRAAGLRAADGRAHAGGAGRGGVRALVSRQRAPRSRSCGRRSMPRFAEAALRRASSAGCCRRRACSASEPVPAREGDALICELCRIRWRPVPASAVRPLRPAARFGELECRLCAGVARRASSGSAARSGSRTARATRCTSSSTRAGGGPPRRWPTRCGGSEPLTGQVSLIPIPLGARRLRSGATIRASGSPRRSARRIGVAGARRPAPAGAGDPDPDRAHARGAAGQRGRARSRRGRVQGSRWCWWTTSSPPAPRSRRPRRRCAARARRGWRR